MRHSYTFLFGIVVLTLGLAACSSADAKSLPVTPTQAASNGAGCSTPEAPGENAAKRYLPRVQDTGNGYRYDDSLIFGYVCRCC